MLFYSALLGFGQTHLPASWSVYSKPLPMPARVRPEDSGLYLVDTTGKYFYTRSVQVNLNTGAIRPFSVYRKWPPPPVEEFRVISSDDDIPGWEPCVFQLIYAKGDVLGAFVRSSSISGKRAGGSIFSKIDGIAHRCDEGILPFLKGGMDWKVPDYDIPNSYKLAPPERSLFVRGSTGEKVTLPAKAFDLCPAPASINWHRGLGYLFWPDIWAIHFRGRHSTMIRLPLPPKPFRGPLFLPVVLADASICRTRGSEENGNRPVGMTKKYGALIYNPDEKKWNFYDGLVVLGNSHDGKYVAYSEYPWKTFQVAKVRE